MSEFFQHYPQINYDITGVKPTKTKSAINIMIRSKIKSAILDDVIAYFPYTIPEAERPDVTAYNQYGNVKYTWLIFLINDIHDPIFDWPLTSREFGSFINDKYGSLNSAKNSIHHYEKFVRPRVEATSTSEAIPLACLEVDIATYNALDEVDRNIVYCYNWEVDRNDAKREIKLIDRRYVADILAEHSEKLN